MITIVVTYIKTGEKTTYQAEFPPRRGEAIAIHNHCFVVEDIIHSVNADSHTLEAIHVFVDDFQCHIMFGPH